MTTRALPLLATLALPGIAGAAGYYLPNQDAFATAKGNAFIATADTAAAVHYNPAGLTQLEEAEAQVNVYSINLGNTVTTAAGSFDAKSKWQAAPSIFYGQPIYDDLAWGMSLTSPFGMGNDWGHGSPFRTVVTEARLAYARATVALAYDLTDTLSVGVSGSGDYADLTLEQGIGARPFDFLRFEGDGGTVAGAVSVLWKPHVQHAFGFTATSSTSLDLDGKVYSDVLGTAPGSIDFVTPMRLAGGYSFRPAPGWNIEANVEWLDWDSLNALYLRSPVLPGGATGVPFHWKSMFIYEAGVSYTMENGYTFAVGYDYNSNAQPDTFFNPAVSDADRHWFNAGFGRKCEDWGWFVAYQFGYSNRDVNGALPTAAGQSANGKYESRHHSVSLSASYRF